MPPISKLSILIPVHNEMNTLRGVLEAVLAVELPCEREVVIVDDGSTDDSAAIIAEFANRDERIRALNHPARRGKGAAIRTAVDALTGDWAIIQDADLEYNPNEIPLMLEPAIAGIADAVFGSRFLSGRYRRAMFFWHGLANRLLTTCCNVLSDVNLTDLGTCYKLVRADILQALVLRSDGYAIEAELVVKLARWGARLYEVPISYRGRSYPEGKKVRPIDGVRTFGALFRYRYFDTFYAKHDGFLILQAVRRAHHFNRWLVSRFGRFIGDNVLEAGCGIGNLTELMLDRRRLVCVDYEDFYLDRLRNAYGHLANISFGRADLTRREDIASAANGRKFDTIVCINVLEHIDDDLCVLGNFAEFLEPGGHVIILVPNDPTNYTDVDRILGHFRRYTRKELTDKMTSRGLEVVHSVGFNRVGGLGWRISGKILRTKSLSPGQMTLFEWLMPIIRCVEPIPFHSHNSLIVVARKPGGPGESAAKGQ